MVKFKLFLTYDDELGPRLVAKGCTKQQLLDVLSRHLMLAEVAFFSVVPLENCEDSFEEFTL